MTDTVGDAVLELFMGGAYDLQPVCPIPTVGGFSPLPRRWGFGGGILWPPPPAV